MSENKTKSKRRVKVAVAGTIVAGVVGFNVCTTKVDRGYVGVVFDQFNGGVQNEVLTSGRQFIMPWQKVSQFATVTKTVYMSADKREGSKEDESIMVKANDGTLQSDLSFTYSFNAEDVVKVQKKYMGDGDYVVNNVLRGLIRSWVNEAASKFTTVEIHQTNTEKVNDAITEHVAKKAKDYGVTIERVTLSETKVSEQVEQAIKDRQTAEQNRKKKEDELKTVEIEKKKAELEAEKKIIEAEGERKANEIRAEGLDDRILKQQAIEKWNGELPTTISENVIKGVN